jgi:hypothetical protein
VIDHVLPDFVHATSVGVSVPGAEVSDVGVVAVLVVVGVGSVVVAVGGVTGGVTFGVVGVTGGAPVGGVTGGVTLGVVVDAVTGGATVAGVVEVTGVVTEGVGVVAAGVPEPPSPQLINSAAFAVRSQGRSGRTREARRMTRMPAAYRTCPRRKTPANVAPLGCAGYA